MKKNLSKKSFINNNKKIEINNLLNKKNLTIQGYINNRLKQIKLQNNLQSNTNKDYFNNNSNEKINNSLTKTILNPQKKINKRNSFKNQLTSKSNLCITNSSLSTTFSEINNLKNDSKEKKYIIKNDIQKLKQENIFLKKELEISKEKIKNLELIIKELLNDKQSVKEKKDLICKTESNMSFNEINNNFVNKKKIKITRYIREQNKEKIFYNNNQYKLSLTDRSFYNN